MYKLASLAVLAYSALTCSSCGTDHSIFGNAGSISLTPGLSSGPFGSSSVLGNGLLGTTGPFDSIGALVGTGSLLGSTDPFGRGFRGANELDFTGRSFGGASTFRSSGLGDGVGSGFGLGLNNHDLRRIQDIRLTNAVDRNLGGSFAGQLLTQDVNLIGRQSNAELNGCAGFRGNTGKCSCGATGGCDCGKRGGLIF